MGTSLTIFDSAVTAMSANGVGLSVTANNIANVNTPGFSRQKVVFAPITPQSTAGLQIGRGVSVESIQRVFDAFTEQQYRDAASVRSKTDTSAETLGGVESVMNEPGDAGLSSYLSNFYNAWHDVSNAPEQSGPRSTLLGKAQILIDRFNGLSKQLRDSRSLIDGNIRTNVSKINDLAGQIVDLNGKIQSSAGDPLLLKDQRNLKVRDLAELVDTTAVETSGGEFQVYIAQGIQLVAGVNRGTLSTAPNALNAGLVSVNFAVGSGVSNDITTRINGGALKASVDARDTNIPAYQTTLDELAYQVATQVNTLHTAGFSLSGVTGNRFFGNLASATDAAATIALDAAVNNTPTAIAASSTLAGIPGNNTTAISIAALQNANIAFTTGSTTFASFYGNLLARVGGDVGNAKSQATFADAVFLQTQNQRERISGVSIEEEQLNLVRYQTAFQAGAKLAGVADELLKTLVNLI